MDSIAKANAGNGLGGLSLVHGLLRKERDLPHASEICAQGFNIDLECPPEKTFLTIGESYASHNNEPCRMPNLAGLPW